MKVMAKPPATAVSKYDNLASVPVLGRRLFFEAREPVLRAKHTGQKTTRYAGG